MPLTSWPACFVRLNIKLGDFLFRAEEHSCSCYTILLHLLEGPLGSNENPFDVLPTDITKRWLYLSSGFKPFRSNSLGHGLNLLKAKLWIRGRERCSTEVWYWSIGRRTTTTTGGGVWSLSTDCYGIICPLTNQKARWPFSPPLLHKDRPIRKLDDPDGPRPQSKHG